MKIRIRIASLFAFATAVGLAAASASAAEFEISMKDKKFSRTTLTVKIGDKVSFKNEDVYAHNIFSLSDAQTFDLGSYPKGQSKSVTFTKAGRVEVECAIHPDHRMSITVTK